MDKLFIDRNVNVYYGSDADKLLDKTNDLNYVDNNCILEVPLHRWNEAQNYERTTWMQLASNCSDDRNYEHFNRFDSYKSIIGNDVKSVIELGCGPFTNLRTILPLLPNLTEISLLDPLLNDYLHHTHCRYKNGQMSGYKTSIYSMPIESFDSHAKYDMVILNNVLEHCYSIPIIFDKVINMMHSGSIFIFCDVTTKNENLIYVRKNLYDAGHPLKLSDEYLNKFLLNFDRMFEYDYYGLHDQNSRHDKYYIGKLK